MSTERQLWIEILLSNRLTCFISTCVTIVEDIAVLALSSGHLWRLSLACHTALLEISTGVYLRPTFATSQT